MSQMDRRASDADVASQLREALTKGLSDEESRQQRRGLIWSTLGGLVGLTLTMLFLRAISGFGRGEGWWIPAAFAVLSLVMAGFRHRQLGPRPPREIGERELAALASTHALCSSCGAVMSKRALGCRCGALRYPRAAAVGVVLLAVLTVLALVGIWVKSGRF